MTVNEVKKVIEEIQQVLAFVALPEEEEMIDLAARHEEYVQAVTARLQEVESLLDKGLKSEAIDIAEQAPNLNELVTALDFPELAAWNDCLMEFGILPIRELPIDIAETLNDAYSVDAPLERLLEKYRTQSLARAPIAERIDTLRKLASEDLDNKKWQSDVHKFEKHRLGLIRNDLQKAIADRAIDTVASIDQEVNGNSWSVKVPTALKQSARDAHQQLRRENARAELEPLCHDLSDAYSAFDEPSGMNLQKRFFALAEIAELDETDALYDIAGPALDWLNEAEARSIATAEFERAKSQLETALNGNTTIEELERLYAQAVRNDNTLPPQLENRLADRIETIRASESRKRVTLLASIVGASLVAIVAVVFVIKTVVFQQLEEGHFVQLESLVAAAKSSGALSPVDDYIAKIKAEDPRFLDNPKILGVVEQFETIRQNEIGRLKQIDGLIASALTLGTRNVRWENFPTAEKALADAEAIALNESERARILETRSQIQSVRSELQKETDATFRTDQGLLVEQIAKLPKDTINGYASVQTTIAELQKRPHVSSELKSSLDALKVKLDQQQSMVTENLEIARNLQAVTKAVGRPSEYRSAISKYTQNHPGTQRSEEFLSLIQSDPSLWEGVVEWNLIRRRIQSANVKVITPVQSQQLVSDYDKFLQSSGPYPGVMDADQRLEFFER